MKKILLTLGTIATIAAPVAAVIACGETPTPANYDDGFKKASLIENFDMNAESQKITDVSSMEYAGKEYDNFESLVKDWTIDANVFLLNDAPNLKGAGVDSVKTDISDGKVIMTLLKTDKSELEPPKEALGIENFRTKLAVQLNAGGDAGYGAWELAHHIVSETSKKVTPLKHSIDSIIYSKAQSLKNKLPVSENKIKFNDGKELIDILEIPEEGYTDLYKNQAIKSFERNNTIVVSFKDESNLASFTQRFGYIDGQANMFNKNDASSRTENLGVVNGQIVSIENGVPDLATSTFKLDVIARNAIKITFLNPKTSVDPEAGKGQFIYLNGFTDVNKDGKVNIEDQSVAGPYTFK